tara:strand:+ start:10879 stop:10998 length:120 start_codon:yes stop_codon:yes gene_type:complete
MTVTMHTQREPDAMQPETVGSRPFTATQFDIRQIQAIQT